MIFRHGARFCWHREPTLHQELSWGLSQREVIYSSTPERFAHNDDLLQRQ